MAAAKTVLVTGSSAGIGRATAELFQKKGWQVAATLRTPAAGKEPAAPDGVFGTALDVTSAVLVLDNASTHKTPAVKRWLLAHPRFVLHFTPTSSSWLNLVERWFGELTTKKLQRGTHRSGRALNTDIRNWIKTWNDNPRPYVWTKPPTRSSTASPGTASELMIHDTSCGRGAFGRHARPRRNPGPRRHGG